MGYERTAKTGRQSGFSEELVSENQDAKQEDSEDNHGLKSFEVTKKWECLICLY